jgi:phosphoserine phosphatase
MGEDDGVFTGQLVETPLTGEARALAVTRYTDANGLSMSECVAYADSSSDLPLLEAVGHPVAVNPDAKLAATARKRGWHVEQWSRAPGARRPLLPLAPARRG